MSNRIRKARYDNIRILNEQRLKVSEAPGPVIPLNPNDDQGKRGTKDKAVKKLTQKPLKEDCGCAASDDTHGDWITGNLSKIDKMMGSMAGDIGSGGCPPGQHWCNETGDCHNDRSPQTQPLSITGMEVINLQERISKRIMKEQTNPFTGGGSGPNWQAAEAAWANFNQSTQGSPPNPDATFLSNMDGKGCGFYQKRLDAQVNSFVNQFGGSLGSGANQTNVTGGQNPAWQSQKYARIMWLADAVYNCNSSSGNNSNSSNAGAQASNADCFFEFLNDPTNDNILSNPVCNNGNQAISQQNMEKTKFRWQSIADCSMLDTKIAHMLNLSQTTTGCEQIRKTAKHQYLKNLGIACC